MNQGKRYLRNTVFALYGTTALYMGLTRLYASTVDTQTPQWLRSTLSLGLVTVDKPAPEPEMKPADLAALRDFTHLNVTGGFEVEIVGAATYKVTFTPAAGSTAQIHARQSDETLSLRASDDDKTGGKGVLRIEMPTLERLQAQDVPLLTLNGLQAEELNVSLHHVAAARLLQNHVARWKIYSGEPLEMQVDKATLTAGSLQTQGNVAIRYGEQGP